MVPRKICHSQTCIYPDDTSICNVVAHAVWQEFEIFDAVLLPDGLCRTELPSAPLTTHSVRNMIDPSFDTDLVAVTINGSDLQAALDHGIRAYDNGYTSSLPATAGMKLQVDARYGTVARLKIMEPTCAYRLVQPSRVYHILTTAELATGGHHYAPLTRSQSTSPTPFRVEDVFWYYAQRVCNVWDPYNSPAAVKQRNQQQPVPEAKVYAAKS